MKKDYKYLLKNVGLLALSNFGSKILVFLLVPLYTRMLTTEEYGTFDLYVSTITLLIPILSLNIIEAVMRYAMDIKTEKTKTFSIGISLVFKSIFILLVLVLINYFLDGINIFNQYPFFLVLYYISNIFFDLATQFVKSIEKIKDFAIASILNSAIMLLLNILFLVVLKLKLNGYFLANCLSFIIPVIFLFFKDRLWTYISFKNYDKNLQKSMTKYSIPLIFNSIGWWITSVSDRYILTGIKGLSANGIYSVSYKIPSILNVIQAIFSQAWILSVVKSYENKEYEFISDVYKLYNCLLIFTCSSIIILTKIISKILLANDFYTAWRYAPYLMISVLFTSLSNFLSGIFAASKNSKILGRTTIIGAIINIIFNFILIYSIGIAGAAISTLISYIVIWAIRYKNSKKIIKLDNNLNKDILSYVILLTQAIIINIIANNLLMYVLEIVLLIILIIINRNEIIKMMNKIFEYIKNNAKKIKSTT